jgi:hypothetical protein
MTHHLFSYVLLGAFSLPLALSSLACSGSVNEQQPPEQNTPAHTDLFACGIALTCAPACVHLGFEDCTIGSGAVDCAGDLWVNGKSGVLQMNDRPGPGNWQGDNLMFFFGDGRALVQLRTRQCPNLDVGCDFEKLDWQLEAHQICDVATPPDTCQPGNCTDFPYVENCMPVDPDWTCEQVTSALPPVSP